MNAKPRQRVRRMIARLNRQIRIGFASRGERRVRVAVRLCRGGTRLCAICTLATCAWDVMVLSGARPLILLWWWVWSCDVLGLAATLIAVCLACRAGVSREDL